MTTLVGALGQDKKGGERLEIVRRPGYLGYCPNVTTSPDRPKQCKSERRRFSREYHVGLIKRFFVFVKKV